jgi:3-oxoacyl-[acyl-carrier protein] reductase
MSLQLKNKKAIVTGGSQGIGKGIAIALAEAGADVLIQYHSAKDKASMTVDEIIQMGRQSYVLMVLLPVRQILNLIYPI